MRKTKLPNIVTILILTMVTTVMWVGFSIYHAFTQAPPAAVPTDIGAALNPSLDTSTIAKVESALYFDPSQIPAISLSTPTSSPIPLRTAQPGFTASPSATLLPSASPSASPVASPTP